MDHAKVVCVLVAIVVVLIAPASIVAQDVSVQSNGGVTVATVGGQPLFEYRDAPHPTKCYMSKWYTPSGTQVLRDSPHDHVHHHALMYAIGIDEVDFWSEVPPEKFGTQVSKSLGASSTSNGGVVVAEVRQAVDWVAPDRRVLAQEDRVIQTHVGAIPSASLLTWKFTLRPAEKPEQIKLWGRHYFGLGMRFVEAMDEGSEILLPKGAAAKSVRGSEQLTRADWCAIQGSAGDSPITVAMFDAPANRRHPASWFTMNKPFAYLSATLNLHEEPLIVTSDKPLMMAYGIAAWDGHVSAEQVEKAYQTWLGMIRK